MNNLLTKVSTDLPLSLMLRLTPAFIGAGTDAMVVPRIHGWLLVALFSLLVSCSSTPPIAFQNNSHRQLYSLNLARSGKAAVLYIKGCCRAISRCHRDEVPAGTQIDSRCCDRRRAKLDQSEL